MIARLSAVRSAHAARNWCWGGIRREQNPFSRILEVKKNDFPQVLEWNQGIEHLKTIRGIHPTHPTQRWSPIELLHASRPVLFNFTCMEMTNDGCSGVPNALSAPEEGAIGEAAN